MENIMINQNQPKIKQMENIIRSLTSLNIMQERKNIIMTKRKIMNQANQIKYMTLKKKAMIRQEMCHQLKKSLKLKELLHQNQQLLRKKRKKNNKIIKIPHRRIIKENIILRRKLPQRRKIRKIKKIRNLRRNLKRQQLPLLQRHQ